MITERYSSYVITIGQIVSWNVCFGCRCTLFEQLSDKLKLFKSQFIHTNIWIGLLSLFFSRLISNLHTNRLNNSFRVLFLK